MIVIQDTPVYPKLRLGFRRAADGDQWQMSSVSDVPSQAVSRSRQPLLLIDRDKFRQNFNKRNFILSHRLCGNPLFSLPRIIELARDTALSRPDDIYYDSGVTDLNERWGTSHPASRSMRRSGASRRLAPGLPSSAPNMILPMPSCLRTACPTFSKSAGINLSATCASQLHLH